MFPVPENCLCSLFPLFLGLCSPEKLALVPLFPKTLGGPHHLGNPLMFKKNLVILYFGIIPQLMHQSGGKVQDW